MKIPVYNQKGEKIGETLLPKEIFGIEMNPDLVHQVAISQQVRKKTPIAHTKTRGEVSGGGRKPWRQKGTGRARHGSTRSPIWKGGGVTFGPRKEKVFKKKTPKKMRRKALFMVLTTKAKERKMFVLDKLEIKKPKTKLMAKLLEKLRTKIKDFNQGSVLIALQEKNDKVVLAARNIPKTKTIPAKDLSVLDLLSFKYLILPKESIRIIKETFLKTKQSNPDVKAR